MRPPNKATNRKHIGVAVRSSMSWWAVEYRICRSTLISQMWIMFPRSPPNELNVMPQKGLKNEYYISLHFHLTRFFFRRHRMMPDPLSPSHFVHPRQATWMARSRSLDQNLDLRLLGASEMKSFPNSSCDVAGERYNISSTCTVLVS